MSILRIQTGSVATLVRVSDPSLTAPAAPSSLVATAVSSSQVNLTWVDNASNETGYLVERSLDGVTWAYRDQVGPSVTAYSDTGLSSGTLYRYRVSAFNQGVYSAPSNVASATTATDVATTYTLTGPSSGLVNTASGAFTLTPNGLYTGTVSVAFTAGFGLVTVTKTWANSSTPQTFTITPNTTGSITLTPTNNGGLTNPSPLIYVSATIIAIDSAWLANAANKGQVGSYKLATAGATYQLAQDVTVPNTGFVVGASNVTLDLNGHTLTYTNGSPMTVPNFGFESGDTTGWDLTGCTSGVASVVAPPAQWFMGGNWCLKLTGITTPQVILSPIINVPNQNIEYCAHIKNACHSDSTIVSMQPVDVAGNPIGTVATDNETVFDSGLSAIAQVHSGYESSVTFPTNPTVTPLPSQIRIKITVTPPGGGDDFYLDDLAVEQSRDYGFYHSSTSSFIPPQLSGVARGFSNFTLKNGTVTQGAANWSCHPCYFRSAHGFTVDSVTFHYSGANTRGIEAKSSSTTNTVNNCSIQANMTRISNRKIIFPAIDFSLSAGTIIVTNNTINGPGHVGVWLQGSGVGAMTSATITDNTITHSSLFTDSYAIWIGYWSSNFTVANNTVNSTARGVIIDGGGGGSTRTIGPGEIHHNTVTMKEKANREYPAVGMEATALRVRNYSCPIIGIHIHDNTFTAINPATSDGVWDWCAIGGRFSFYTESGVASTGNLCENNTFKAIVQGQDSTISPGGESSFWPHSSAWALSIPTSAAGGGGWVFRDNILESNHVSLHIGDYDNDTVTSVKGMLFWGNTSHQSADSPGIVTYNPWVVGDTNSLPDSTVKVISQKNDGGTTPAITWVGTAPESLSVGWTLTVVVKDGSNNVQAGATVTVTDNTSTVAISGTTDGTGTVILPVVSTVYSQPGTNPAVINSTNKNPQTVAATSGALAGSQSISLTADTTVNLTVA